MHPTRKQIREALDTLPIDGVLGVKGELTHKQKTFARLVAQGDTGADAYRKAYQAKGKPKSVGNNASALKKHAGIQREIEAFKAANEALAYQTPQQLRALVIHSLVKVLADPDAKEATKVQAAKVLGTVTEVAAFTNRTETHVIKSSEDAKTALLAKLREVMNNGATDVQVIDPDSLVRELAADSTPALAESADDDGATPTTPNAVRSPSIPIHTIPHTQSLEKSDPPPIDSVASLEDELSGNTPVSKTE